MLTCDVLVVGAGIIGNWVAYKLASDGLRTMVVDQGGIAAGTSRASEGNLLVSDRSTQVDAELMLESQRLWSDAIESLGNECEYQRKGSLLVTTREEQIRGLDEHGAMLRGAGASCQVVTSEVREIEPSLGRSVVAALWVPRDAQIQPMLACYQLARSAQALGATYEFYCQPTALKLAPAGATVELSSGAQVSSRWVVVCAGVWTNEVLQLAGLDVPVVPRKGHVAVLNGGFEIRTKIVDYGYEATTNPTISELRTAAVIESTQAGSILCGSSRQFVGFDRSVDLSVVMRILADCCEIVPGLRALNVIRAYCGLRPSPPDGRPIIGALDPDGPLVVATGHEGAGHGLAAITATIVSDAVHGRASRYASLVDPRRFVA